MEFRTLGQPQTRTVYYSVLRTALGMKTLLTCLTPIQVPVNLLDLLWATLVPMIGCSGTTQPLQRTHSKRICRTLSWVGRCKTARTNIMPISQRSEKAL